MNLRMLCGSCKHLLCQVTGPKIIEMVRSVRSFWTLGYWSVKLSRMPIRTSSGGVVVFLLVTFLVSKDSDGQASENCSCDVTVTEV
jgi:hypothetical protein